MKLTIWLEPMAQKRDRIGRLGKTGRAMSFKNPDQWDYEVDLMILLNKELASLERPLFDEAILVGIRTYRHIPKSWSKKKRAQAMAGQIRPISTPDLSNLIKNIEDCANKHLWRDDSLIVEYLPGTGKYYDDGHGLRWEIEIQTLKNHIINLK
jgi:Holliday junction resolvase RusA-like endonuclease